MSGTVSQSATFILIRISLILITSWSPPGSPLIPTTTSKIRIIINIAADGTAIKVFICCVPCRHLNTKKLIFLLAQTYIYRKQTNPPSPSTRKWSSKIQVTCQEAIYQPSYSTSRQLYNLYYRPYRNWQRRLSTSTLSVVCTRNCTLPNNHHCTANSTVVAPHFTQALLLSPPPSTLMKASLPDGQLSLPVVSVFFATDYENHLQRHPFTKHLHMVCIGTWSWEDQRRSWLVL